jgi:hypothetical protein
MSKRYYLSPIVREEQTDTDPETGETETTVRYLPKVAILLRGVADARIGSVIGQQTGDVFDPPWALVVVDAPDHGVALNDRDLDVLPAFPLDARMTAMQNATRTAMINRLRARGVNVDAVGNADGYRDVIKIIGQRVRPEFDETLTTFFS